MIHFWILFIMELFKQPRSSVSHTQNEQYALWSRTISSLRCTSFPFSNAKMICINGGLMHARQRCVCVCVQLREVGIRWGRWTDKDNKRRKRKQTHHTPTHRHTRHKKKGFEVCEHLSNLQSSAQCTQEHKEMVSNTQKQLPARPPKKEKEKRTAL